jgi:hypothetical protein
VIVGGEPVVEDYHHVSVDERSVVTAHRAAARRLVDGD